MSQPELLAVVIATLQNLGIEFMLSGSYASSIHGEARATHDIDVVVSLSLQNVQPLVTAFQGERYYLSEVAIREAIRLKRMFNLLELSTGEKVDFWVLTESAFDQARFARRIRIKFGDQFVNVTSAEDTILMKLVWGKLLGGSEKQFNDVLRVYELQSDVLDHAYLQKWLKELNVEDIWQKVIQKANPIAPLDDSAT